MYHIRCDNIRQYIYHQTKLKDNDIIISTDASRDPNTKLTGIGIFIKDGDNFHKYAEPLGCVSNNFGELFAIGKFDFLLTQFGIDTRNRRKVLMTDSLCSFCPLITPPNNIKKQIKFPNLFRKTQRNLKSEKVTLWKIKSHTDKINKVENYVAARAVVNPYNFYADRLGLDWNFSGFIFTKFYFLFQFWCFTAPEQNT